mgnify:FL=1
MCVRDAEQSYVNFVKVHSMHQKQNNATNVNVAVKEEIIRKIPHYVKTAKKQAEH